MQRACATVMLHAAFSSSVAMPEEKHQLTNKNLGSTYHIADTQAFKFYNIWKLKKLLQGEKSSPKYTIKILIFYKQDLCFYYLFKHLIKIF